MDEISKFGQLNSYTADLFNSHRIVVNIANEARRITSYATFTRRVWPSLLANSTSISQVLSCLDPARKRLKFLYLPSSSIIKADVSTLERVCPDV